MKKPIAIIHDTFTIERILSAPPARVYEALSIKEIKARWFAGPPNWKKTEDVWDFRVGGRERMSGEHSPEMSTTFDAIYMDIVPEERVVYVYEMHVNGRKISTSLASFELFPHEGNKTRMVLTEQGAYFDDPDMRKYAPNGQAASRLGGTNALMDKIAALFVS